MALFQKQRTKKFQALFLQQLSDLLHNGLALDQALAFLTRIHPQQAIFFASLKKELTNGASFDRCLDTLHFPAIICSQLHFAQTHLQFTETLKNCAEGLNFQLQQTQFIRRFIQYPAVLFVLLSGVILVLQAFVVPQIEMLFIHTNAPPPAIFNLLKYAHFWLLGSVCITLLLLFFFKQWLQQKNAYQRALFWCRFPLTRRLMPYYYTHLFAREFALLIKSGLSLQKILKLSSTSHYGLFNHIARHINDGLLQGLPFATLLKNHPLFLPLLAIVIQHGEASGFLSQELMACHRYCEQLLKQRLQKIVGLIQPLLLLLVGGCIIIIYLSIMLPLFETIEYI